MGYFSLISRDLFWFILSKFQIIDIPQLVVFINTRQPKDTQKIVYWIGDYLQNESIIKKIFNVDYTTFILELYISAILVGAKSVQELIQNHKILKRIIKKHEKKYETLESIQWLSLELNLQGIIYYLVKFEKHTSDLNTMFQSAVCRNFKHVVNFLLNKKNIDPSTNRNLAIRFACGQGYFEIVEMLLKHDKVDPTALYCTAFYDACDKNHTNVVKQLVKHPKYSPHFDFNYAIKLAIVHGNKDLILFLLQDEIVKETFNVDKLPKKILKIVSDDIITFVKNQLNDYESETKKLKK